MSGSLHKSNDIPLTNNNDSKTFKKIACWTYGQHGHR